MAHSREYNEDDDDEFYVIDGASFADPYGTSALRAATPNNPRMFPCPTCGEQDVLTHIDVQHGYQCDQCANRTERG